MGGGIIWFLAAAAGQSAADLANIGYFLKELNTPFWHWFFRVGFGLGLAVALLVYWRHRADGGDRR